MWWYFSATWWIPPLRCRCGRNDIVGDVSAFCGNQSRPFGCGTAHRPFPTVSLVGGRFQLGRSKDEQCGIPHCRNNRRKGNHAESHRRERPMCRSAAWQIYPVRTTGTIHRPCRDGFRIPYSQEKEVTALLPFDYRPDSTAESGRWCRCLRYFPSPVCLRGPGLLPEPGQAPNRSRRWICCGRGPPCKRVL